MINKTSRTILIFAVKFLIIPNSMAGVILEHETEVNIIGTVISFTLSHNGQFGVALIKEGNHYFLNKYDTSTGQALNTRLIGDIDEKLLASVTKQPLTQGFTSPLSDQVFSDLNESNWDALFPIQTSQNDALVALNMANKLRVFNTSDLSTIIDVIPSNPGAQIATFNLDDQLQQLAIIGRNGHGEIISIPSDKKMAPSERFKFDVDIKKYGLPRCIDILDDSIILIETLNTVLLLDQSTSQFIVAGKTHNGFIYNGHIYKKDSENDVFIDAISKFKPHAFGHFFGDTIKFFITTSFQHLTFNDFYTTIDSLESCSNASNFKVQGSVMASRTMLQVIGLYDFHRTTPPLKFYFPPYLRLIKSTMINDQLTVLVKNQHADKYFFIKVIASLKNSTELMLSIQKSRGTISLKNAHNFSPFSFIFA